MEVFTAGSDLDADERAHHVGSRKPCLKSWSVWMKPVGSSRRRFALWRVVSGLRPEARHLLFAA